MPAAAAVADPGLNEFEIGGRWFPCVPRVDPAVLVGVTRRAQDAPTDPTDPKITGWLGVIIGFLVTVVPEAEHDRLVATITAHAGADPDRAAADVAEVFAGLLAMYSDAQLDEIRQHILAAERAMAVEFPARETPVVRRRSQVADIERINRKHGSKATGEVLG